MTYGTAGLDWTKGAVLLSCAFHVFMIGLIFTNPTYLIASERGMGWWDVLQEHPDDKRVFLYPRIWAYRLLLELLVRLNWIFTVESAPALYRCVLLTYLLPAVQYVTESHVYKTLPPFDPIEFLVLNVPWFMLLFHYTRYTTEEPVTDGKSKRQ